MLKNGASAGASGASGSGSSSGGGFGGPTTDVEGKLRRLAADVRQLKDRMAEFAAAAFVASSGPSNGQVCAGCSHPRTS